MTTMQSRGGGQRPFCVGSEPSRGPVGVLEFLCHGWLGHNRSKGGVPGEGRHLIKTKPAVQWRASLVGEASFPLLRPCDWSTCLAGRKRFCSGLGLFQSTRTGGGRARRRYLCCQSRRTGQGLFGQGVNTLQ